MNKAKIVKYLQEKYPGKKIICLPEIEPTEILCEIDPTEEHLGRSVAISIIDTSVPHKHLKTTEVYIVTEGELHVFLNGKENVLFEGDSLTIPPGTIHWANGNETWITVTATPGWTKEDHVLV